MLSRSFGHDVSDFEQLRAAVISFAVRVGEKLRKQYGCAQTVCIFAHTNPSKYKLPQYKGSVVVKLDCPTKGTGVLIESAVQDL